MLFPSSVHEVLALDGALRGAYGLVDMLWSVNQNRTAPQDRLSSHPYLYANGVIRFYSFNPNNSDFFHFYVFRIQLRL